MNKVVGVIAAHPDDEVLGCGGTIAKMSSEGHEVHILLLGDGETSRIEDTEITHDQRIENRNQAALSACKILGCASVEQLTFPDNKMDSVALLDIVKPIEDFISKFKPDTIFTHHSGDVNIDHRIVHEAVIVSCRPQPSCSVEELLFFETLSSTEWRPPNSGESFLPNWFVDISKTIDIKLKALDAYKEEMRPFPHSRSVKAVEALATWRGASVGVVSAEAFILGRKII